MNTSREFQSPIGDPGSADGRSPHRGPGRRRYGRGRRGLGGPGNAGADFGGPPPRGPGFRGSPVGRPGAKVRRGDTRAAVLLVLLDGPMHGYQIMSELAERSEGRWTPSPGSIYPVIKTLVADGLVSVDHSDGRRVVTLTKLGTTIAEDRKASGPPPWESLGPDTGQRGLMVAFRQLAGAMTQVGEAGNGAQVERATVLIDETRRALYRLLADEGNESTTNSATQAQDRSD